MAGGAGNGAIAAESFIKEDALTQFRRAQIIGHGVGGVGGQWGKAAQPERAQNVDFVFCPGRCCGAMRVPPHARRQ